MRHPSCCISCGPDLAIVSRGVVARIDARGVRCLPVIAGPARRCGEPGRSLPAPADQGPGTPRASPGITPIRKRSCTDASYTAYEPPASDPGLPQPSPLGLGVPAPAASPEPARETLAGDRRGGADL